MWPKLTVDALTHFPRSNGDSVLPAQCRNESEGWKHCIESILEIRSLEDGWDGQGTEAPTPEVVDSAMILAVMLRERNVRPPTSTVQGVCGDVCLEWQWWNSTTLNLEVTEPYGADILLLTPGKTAEHSTIRQLVVAQ